MGHGYAEEEVGEPGSKRQRLEDNAAPPQPRCSVTPTFDRIEAALKNLQEVDLADLGVAGNELMELWINAYDEPDPIAASYRLLNLHQGGLHTQQDLDAKYEREFDRIVTLYNAYVGAGIIDKNNVENRVGQRFVRMLEIAKSARSIVMSLERARRASNLSVIESEAALNTFRCHLVDRENLTPYQDLLLYLLDETYKGAYRKYEDYIYRQVMTTEGLPSRAWEQVMEIRKFITRAVKKDDDFAMWKNLTSGRDNLRAATEYLKESNDLELPFLHVDRHLFSFQTGVLDVNSMQFYPHVMDESSEQTMLDPSRVAVRYFDVNLDYATVNAYEDWRDIPTPYLHSILSYQKLPAEAIDWAYIMMGRMLYQAGDKDQWQICPFFKGRAGTGKSTICRVIHHIYGEFTGILSNNIEGKFGLYAFMDKLATICLEVKQDFGLDQGEWQSMVTVEPMSIPVKHKAAKDNFTWKSNMMFAGNVMPGWADNAGSISRRFLTFLFEEKVHKMAPTLLDSVRAEIGSILVKINRAYRNAVDMHKKKDIWEIVPPYFVATQRKIIADTQPLAAFLTESELIVTGNPALYMPLSDFKNAHTQFCALNGITKKSAWKEDYYKTTFEEWKIFIEENTKRVYGGSEMVKTWVVGVGLRTTSDGGGGGAPTTVMMPAAADDTDGGSAAAENVVPLDVGVNTLQSKGAVTITRSNDDYMPMSEFRAMISSEIGASKRLGFITHVNLQDVGLKMERATVRSRNNQPETNTWIVGIKRNF